MIRIHATNFGFETALRCSTKKGQYFVEPHLHQFPEIVLVREGALDVIIDGKKEKTSRPFFFAIDFIAAIKDRDAYLRALEYRFLQAPQALD